MKIFCLIIFLLAGMAAFSQVNAAAGVAENIAQKMKDTLGLTNSKKQQLYDINMQLHEAKMVKRQLYMGTDSLRIHIQLVENTRDSLYRAVLNEEKYQLYLQKKQNLIRGN